MPNNERRVTMRLNKELFENSIFVGDEAVPFEPHFNRLMDVVDVNEVVSYAHHLCRKYIEYYNFINPDELTKASGTITAEDLIEKIPKIRSKEDLRKKTGISTKQKMSRRYMCCPFCRTFSSMEKLLTPIDGWDVVIKRHAKEILARLIFPRLSLCPLSKNHTLYYIPEQELIMNCLTLRTKEETDNPFIGYKTDKNEKKQKDMKGYFLYDLISEEFACTKEGIPKAVCPYCKKEIPMQHGWLLRPKKPYKPHHLFRDSRWFDYNTMDANIDVFVQGNKFTVSLIKWHLYPNVHGKLHVESTNIRETLNLETGQTYLFREIDMKTKKPTIISEKYPKIMNITYSNNFFALFNQKQTEYVIKKLCECKGIEDLSDLCSCNYISYCGRDSLIPIINRYGCYGRDFIKTFVKLSDSKFFKTSDKTMLYRISKDKDMFDKLIKKHGITGKKKKRLFAENPMLFIFDKYIDMFAIKNPDVRLRLMENPMKLAEIKVAADTSFINMDACSEIVRFKSESEFANAIIEFKPYKIIDTLNMYDRIIKKVSLDDNGKKKLLSGNFSQLHDKFAYIINIMDDEPFYIPYTKEQLSINCKCGKYTFMLAKTSLEMKSVGKTMHICVGSYDKSALDHSCIIIFMKDKDDKPAACIELSPDMKELVQFKDYCNQSVSEDKLEAAVSFLKEIISAIKEMKMQKFLVSSKQREICHAAGLKTAVDIKYLKTAVSLRHAILTKGG